MGEWLEGEPAEGRVEDADVGMLNVGRAVVDVHGDSEGDDVGGDEGGDHPCSPCGVGDVLVVLCGGGGAWW